MADLTPLCSDDLKANLAALLTRSAQAMCFLENEIKAPLENDCVSPFTILLSIMENFDDVELQMLAKEIQEYISVNSSGVCMVVSGYCYLEHVNNNGRYISCYLNILDVKTLNSNIFHDNNTYAKQRHLGCKKVCGQSEATLQTGRHDQKF